MTYSYDRTAARALQVLDLSKLTSAAKDGLYALDERYVGTDNYMGVAYFWNTEYKWELRDAAPKKRREVHEAFRKARLKLDDESPAHAAIVEKAFGKLGPH
jgi:hypothetical protein